MRTHLMPHCSVRLHHLIPYWCLSFRGLTNAEATDNSFHCFVYCCNAIVYLTGASPFLLPLLARKGLMGTAAAVTTAQLVCPVGMQWFSSPLHLLALDHYNRPEGKGTRMAAVKPNYVSTAIARSGRIFPAFGVGTSPVLLFILHTAFMQRCLPPSECIWIV
jgi:hypothetical protein